MPRAASRRCLVDKQLANDCGGTYEDTEGLINLPLTVKEILAVVFFKENGPGDWRVSMRSKGDIDINAIAKEFGGGGHKNASGCSATHGDLRQTLQSAVVRARRIDDRHRAGVMDGVLVVDKPHGLTSHDVVAVARRCSERIPHRPHRNARSTRHRRTAAGVRARHSARSVPLRVGEALRRDDPFRPDDRFIRRHGNRGQPIGHGADA